MPPATEVPVIDMSQSDELLAEKLVDSFSNIGFASLCNHGVPNENIKSAFAASGSFFGLPADTKLQYKYRGHDSNRGFIAAGLETHERNTSGADSKETFDIGKEGEEGMETPWPKEVTGFRKDMLEYFEIFDTLHLKILRLLAIGLKMDNTNFFVDKCNAQHCNLRLLHYPQLERDSTSDKLLERGALHTDFGTITLLVQDQSGGLRVHRRDGSWTLVKPMKGTIVVNVGDMLQRWTNDVLRATPHQVVESPDNHSDTIPERFSIAFFCNANKDVLLEPVACLSKEPPKYPPVNAMEYLTMRLSATIHEN